MLVIHPHARRSLLAAACTTSVWALTACGGGAGSADTGPVAPAVSLSLTGNAATGAAIAGRPVEARCNGGSGNATSAGDGGYKIELSAGTLPCVLRVTAADGTVLHSLAVGSGAAAKANLTPVSELVLAQLAGTAPASYFGTFDAAAAAGLTTPKAQAATSAVVALLKAAGVDLTTVGDVLTAALVPANGSTAGNGFDQALEALKAKLSSTGLTLAALTDSIVISSPAAPPAALSALASLPVDLLLMPAAATCTSLRSGRYRIVIAESNAGQVFSTEVVTLDAKALKVTNSQGEVNQLTAVAGERCRFTTPAGGEVAVSAAGVVVAQAKTSDGPFKAAVLFPEQAHGLAKLAGEWNALAQDRSTPGGPIHLTSASFIHDGSGGLTALTFCDDVISCKSGTAAGNPDFPPIKMAVNASGGFDRSNARDGWTDRAFVYRAGGGELMLVTLSPGGHMTFATRKVTRALPAEGDVSQGWQLVIVPNATTPYYTASSISRYKSTVSALDSVKGQYQRVAVTDFTNNVTRPETLAINALRDGYLRRLPGSTTASNGSTSTISEWIGLPMRGMGFTPVGVLGSQQMVLAVAQAQ